MFTGMIRQTEKESHKYIEAKVQFKTIVTEDSKSMIMQIECSTNVLWYVQIHITVLRSAI